jgi:hypothetical protein
MMLVCMLLQCLYRFHGPIPLKIAIQQEFRTCGNTSMLYKCAQVMGVKCSYVHHSGHDRADKYVLLILETRDSILLRMHRLINGVQT